MKFSELIDKESMLLDRKRLAEWKRNAGKFELFTKINEIMYDFLYENNMDLDNDNVVLIFKLVEKIKNYI